MKAWMACLALLGLTAMDAIANDCRYYRNCGQYSREPYKVTYAYPDEWWGYEKRVEGDKVVIKARELEDGEQYRQPLPPVDQSIQFNIEDDFPLENRVHTYTTTVEDEQGREHILRLQWASWFETKHRRSYIFKRRHFYHYVKVTLNDKLLFHINDRVDKGVYDYEDFFRVGQRKYRILATMQTHSERYYFGASLVNTY